MALQREVATNFQGKKRPFLETNSQGFSWLDDLHTEKKTCEELMEIIVSKIEAEPSYYKNVNRICDHLQQIMRYFNGQHVKILLFGSSVTKLALRDSDVDIYLDFGENLPEPPIKLVKTLRKKVRKFGYFKQAIPILAKVPIVRCIHQSQISCDLSFSNALGVSNSNFIKFLVSTDKRIRPLILILKFIMKSHGLLGHPNFTSFGLTILILFFLQNLENPIIPSVSYIQSLATRREIVADWDVSFTTDIHSLPTVNNQLPVVELLQKFFEFYSTFEFGFYVISFFTGKSYLKPVFSNPDLLPQEFYLYKQNLAKNEFYNLYVNNFVCVQGPFNHGSNITRHITQKSLNHFQDLCSANAATGKELLNENEENKKKYLIHLFHQNNDTSKDKRKKNDDVVIFVGEEIKLNNCSCTEDSLRNEWAKDIFKKLQDILCRVMKCDIESQVTNSENDSSSFTNDEKVIRCVMPYPELASKQRNAARNEFDFPQDMSTIEKEEIISNFLCDTVFINTTKVLFKFEVICRVKKNPTCFCMDLNFKETQNADNNLVNQTLQFLQSNIPRWIK